MGKRSITDALSFIAAAELVGALSALASKGSFAAYSEIAKPPLSPPGWVFAPMWAILYALMGISAYLIYESDSENKRRALLLYAAQLFVNFLWSPVFFGIGSPMLAAVLIIILLVLIIALTAAFWRIRPAAAYLLIPYLLWTAYAAYLNIGILLISQ